MKQFLFEMLTFEKKNLLNSKKENALISKPLKKFPRNNHNAKVPHHI